jgi:16S rRNA processing protein RimM
MEKEWVTVARLTRTRGNRGELAALSLSSHAERFQHLREVVLFGAQGFPGEARPFGVEEVWEHGPRLIFKFHGVDSISDAEWLRGAEVRVPMCERPALLPGEYYHSDLTGCEVVDRESGECLGVVTGWLDQGGSGLLEVESSEHGKELLIPFARAICVDIDVERKRIGVDLPEGLKELNN